MLQTKGIAGKQNVMDLSISQLNDLAFKTIDEIEKKLSEILEKGKELNSKLANLKSHSGVRKYSETENKRLNILIGEAKKISNLLDRLQERWQKRINCISSLDKVTVSHPWSKQMKEILTTNNGRFCINFLAVEYLNRLVNDGRTKQDFVKKNFQIQDILEKINLLEAQAQVLLEIKNNRITGNFIDPRQRYNAVNEYDQAGSFQKSPGSKFNTQG